jgi:hypothetical protein
MDAMMEHDVKSLQVFMEGRLDAIDERATRQHAENTSVLQDIHRRVTETNGRLRKAEVAIAVLKFAVYTIGGALLLATMQVLVKRFGGG